mgnify:FL=1
MKTAIATIVLAITAINSVFADEITDGTRKTEAKTPAMIQALKIIQRDSFYSDRAAAIDPSDLPVNEDEAVKKMLEAVGDLNGKYVEEDFLAFKKEHIKATTVKENGYAIAVIELKQFSRGSAEKFEKILREKLTKKISGLILDLRDNSGGYLDETVLIASQFIGKNKLITTIKNGKGKKDTLFSLNEKNKDFELPMAIIVNRRSASASEILSSALQHHKIATIVGEPTYGKTHIQRKYDINGKTLSLTTERWRKPGASTNDGTVIPDAIITEEGRKNILLEAAKKIVLYKIDKTGR